MSSHARRQLSPVGWVKLSAAVALTVFRTIVSASWTLLFARPPNTHTRRIIAAAFIRSRMNLIGPAANRELNPPTGTAIARFCTATKRSHSTIPVDCGPSVPQATLHFLGCEPTGTPGLTFLYLHGGGYVDPVIGPGHLPLAVKIAQASGAPNLVLLEYTLAPDLPFPGPLAQAAAALDILLRSRPANSIVIGGDSAGGNLCLSLLAHIRSPKPGIPAIAALPTTPAPRLRGACLISPWVRVTSTAHSYASKDHLDILSKSIVDSVSTIVGLVPGDMWAEALAAPEGFWADNGPVDRVLLTAGADECFVDDIVELGTKMGAGGVGSGAPAEISVAEHEVHAQSVVDLFMRLPDGRMTKDIMAWAAVFKTMPSAPNGGKL